MGTASLLVGLVLIGQCVTDAPARSCPPAGVVHEMLGSVGGKIMRFTGWHDSTGQRRYLPGDNPEFDAALTAAGMGPVGSSAKPAPVATVSAGPSPGAPGNFGVDLAHIRPGQQGLIRTNDPLVGAALNGSIDLPSESGRPCPAPGPCPLPDVVPTPGPAGAPSLLIIGLGVALGVAGCVVLVGALIAGLVGRKATS